jgi:hypothetical protein
MNFIHLKLIRLNANLKKIKHLILGKMLQLLKNDSKFAPKKF